MIRGAIARQASNPQRAGSQADRIPADWGRVTKLESKRSGRLGSPVAAEEAAAAPVTPAPSPAPSPAPTPAASTTADSIVEAEEITPSSTEDGTSVAAKPDDSESAKTPCLQQVWRNVGFCYAAKTTSFMEPNAAAPKQRVQSKKAVSDRPAVPDGMKAGSKQGSPKMSLRVKKMWSDQSKQIKQCMTCQ